MKIAILAIFGIGALILSAIVCAKYWERGVLTKFSPPLVGLIVGIVFALVHGFDGIPTFSAIEMILGCFLCGWVFWLGIWFETRL
jgi:hypothetical protein